MKLSPDTGVRVDQSDNVGLHTKTPVLSTLRLKLDLTLSLSHNLYFDILIWQRKHTIVNLTVHSLKDSCISVIFVFVLTNNSI